MKPARNLFFLLFLGCSFCCPVLQAATVAPQSFIFYFINLLMSQKWPSHTSWLEFGSTLQKGLNSSHEPAQTFFRSNHDRPNRWVKLAPLALTHMTNHFLKFIWEVFTTLKWIIAKDDKRSKNKRHFIIRTVNKGETNIMPLKHRII